MQLVKPSVAIVWITGNPLVTIELAGRTCYKSEDKITEGSAATFVSMLLKRGHEAMIEHASASYRIVCDRGVTHEIVRHRLFSYAQESTRYCNYKEGVEFIIPPWIRVPEHLQYRSVCVLKDDNKLYHVSRKVISSKGCGFPPAETSWLIAMATAEDYYLNLLTDKWTPQQARSVLPNSLKTEIVVTGNLREWRHFFKLRCDKKAHPQMQEIANMVLADMQQRVPIVFDDIQK